MSIGELTSANFPRYSRRTLQRRLKLATIQAHKSTRRRIKKTIRSLAAWQRSQYYLATAVRDVKMATRRNEDIVLATTIVALTVVFAFGSTIAQIVLQSFLTMSYLNDITGLSVLLLSCMFAGVLMTLTGWLAAWLCNSTSLALMDGATRRRNKSLRLTFRRALKLAARTATSWLLVLLVLTVPLMTLAAFTLGWLLNFSSGEPADYLVAMAVCALMGTLWLLYAATTFILAPQVAIFEPKLPLLDTLARSRQLLYRRGRPFVFALYLVDAAVLAAAYGAAAGLSKLFQADLDVVLFAVALLVVVVSNMILTMLYRKRKLARVN